MSRRITVTVDKTLCIGNQACVLGAPGVFSLDSDGKSEVADVTAAPEEAIIEAGLNCPVGAISVNDADSGEDLLD